MENEIIAEIHITAKKTKIEGEIEAEVKIKGETFDVMILINEAAKQIKEEIKNRVQNKSKFN